ncbi:MAG: hypothetical protein J0H42_20690 [Rhizobiales bacterium]|nr:hypothetical protein [Hyphomicrobiales bacterium]
MQSLAQFILGRFKELDEAEAPLREKLKAFSDERDQLRRAAAAAGIDLGALEPELAETSEQFRTTRRSIPEKTIKDAVLDVLKAKGAGMTALEILAAINLKFSTDYPRTSLSPQLSRLKADGKIDREGIVWSLGDGSENQKSAPMKSDALL